MPATSLSQAAACGTESGSYSGDEGATVLVPQLAVIRSPSGAPEFACPQARAERSRLSLRAIRGSTEGLRGDEHFPDIKDGRRLLQPLRQRAIEGP